MQRSGVGEVSWRERAVVLRLPPRTVRPPLSSDRPADQLHHAGPSHSSTEIYTHMHVHGMETEDHAQYAVRLYIAHSQSLSANRLVCFNWGTGCLWCALIGELWPLVRVI